MIDPSDDTPPAAGTGAEPADDRENAETEVAHAPEAAAAEESVSAPRAAAADPAPAVPGERIAKVMSRAGVASRREAERMIVERRVTVNGRVIDSPALDVTPADRVAVDGKPVEAPQETRLWLYYKPVGLVSTDSDEKGRQTIQDALPRDLPRVMTVGRLDLNSEGLLLLTNDGTLKRVLELPSTGWPRRYRVRVNGSPNDLTLAPLKRGITVDGEEFAPMEVSIDSSRGANSWLTVGIREGRNREIRRAMAHVGLTVNRLIRIGYGPFKLADMEKNEVREVKRRVLREQLGGLMPGAAPTEDQAEAPRKPRGPRRGEAGPGAGSRPLRGAAGVGRAAGGPRLRRDDGAERPTREPRPGADARPDRPARKPRASAGERSTAYERRPASEAGADRPARSPRAGTGGGTDRPARKPWKASGSEGPTGAAKRPARGSREGMDAQQDRPARKPWTAERAQGTDQKRAPGNPGAAKRPARVPREADAAGPDRRPFKPRAGGANAAGGGKGPYQRRGDAAGPRGPASAGGPGGHATRSGAGDGGTEARRGSYKGKPGAGGAGQGGARPGGSGKPRPPSRGGGGTAPRGPGGKPPRPR